MGAGPELHLVLSDPAHFGTVSCRATNPVLSRSADAHVELRMGEGSGRGLGKGRGLARGRGLAESSAQGGGVAMIERAGLWSRVYTEVNGAVRKGRGQRKGRVLCGRGRGFVERGGVW